MSAGAAYRLIHQYGYSDVYALRGGLARWQTLGLPVVNNISGAIPQPPLPQAVTPPASH